MCTHHYVQSLQAECPGEPSDHVHLPYAIRFDGHRCNFDTAIESEYPELLCKRIAQCLKNAFVDQYAFKAPTNSALSGVKQTKNMHHLFQNSTILPNPNLPIRHVSFSSLQFQGEKTGRVANMEFTIVSAVHQACRKPEPLFNLMTKGIGFVADVRTKSANLINKLSQELKCEEARYHASLPHHAQKVLKGKNVLLFKKLLEDNGFEDVSAVDMMAGVNLVGMPGKSPLFESKFVPAITTSD